MFLKNGWVLNSSFQFEKKNIQLNGETIEAITNEIIEDDTVLDLTGLSVIPGLIDCHIHGAVGADTMDAKDALNKISKFLLQNGVTSFLPTTMSMDMASIRSALEATCSSGAEALGFHLEGPYLCREYCGAQNEKYLKAPDVAEFQSLPNIKMVTVAPELSGGLPFIKQVRDKGITVSLGHSKATYEQGLQAVKAGASCITHMFNGMAGLHHREPGLMGAAYEKDIFVQIICDGVHIHPTVVKMLYQLFGSNRMVLISDAMRATGLADGTYEFGGQKIIVSGGQARTETGHLAGSTCTLWDCIGRACTFGIPFEEAVKMASKTPADLLGLSDRGVIAPKKRADFIFINQKREIQGVMKQGKLVVQSLQ